MMQTRCPRCQTLFRVTPEQLKARRGRVRCGHCKNVFNALEALEDEQPAAAAPRAPFVTGAPKPPPPAAAEKEVAVEEDVAAEEAPLLDDVSPAAKAAESIPPEPAAQEERVVPQSVAPAESDVAPLLGEEERLPRAWPWVLGVLATLLLLAFQAAIQFRVELSVRYPGSKPALQELCRLVGCTVPLPQKIDLIGIELSDLHPDPSGEGRLQLVATLRNRAPFVQPYPHLEVTLTDTGDQPLIRRVFAPEEYLPADTAKAGFAAKGEQPISLLLEAPGVAAAGYRLYVFYP